MNLNWRDPSRESPKHGQTIWILTVHKSHEPGGYGANLFVGTLNNLNELRTIMKQIGI